MKIKQAFLKEILQKLYGDEFQIIFDDSLVIQYLDKKTDAVNRDCSARRNLANLYAIYSMTHYYVLSEFESRDAYERFEGYPYSELKTFANDLYGGAKLQNHGFNDRVSGEFKRKKKIDVDLFINNGGKYKIHPDYLIVDDKDIAIAINQIIEKYIELIETKDENTMKMLDSVIELAELNEKKKRLKKILGEDAEARLFEIFSYSILKRYYSKQTVFFGENLETIGSIKLTLYKTGRTNANDGGIDFVLKPVGRFFQVTEVDKYNKYFLDIDKVMRFPVTFVVKTNKSKEVIYNEMIASLKDKYGDEKAKIENYENAIEEIITMNELNAIIDGFDNNDVLNVVNDTKLYFRLEMNIEESAEMIEE